MACSAQAKTGWWMKQALADIGIYAYRFAQDGSATKADIANLETELAEPRG
jgi:zinc transporter